MNGRKWIHLFIVVSVFNIANCCFSFRFSEKSRLENFAKAYESSENIGLKKKYKYSLNIVKDSEFGLILSDLNNEFNEKIMSDIEICLRDPDRFRDLIVLDIHNLKYPEISNILVKDGYCRVYSKYNLVKIANGNSFRSRIFPENPKENYSKYIEGIAGFSDFRLIENTRVLFFIDSEFAKNDINVTLKNSNGEELNLKFLDSTDQSEYNY
ncbi:hypothetical protein [Leptospira sp. GIMC2001]|uniref:hypothetical protein n=1 Tax=Leptospira sp. GIMC2001 TaxID=1513297 RepID=UPI0023497FDC|nr:hypothetical protein [Leptospira sp. GIMC2001]WCL50438.1 hypothetical protein O4O04_06355 [Leptospira sp. GIMC2001]